MPPSETVLASTADRIGIVFDWIVACHSERNILAAIAEKWPGQNPKPLIFGAMKRITAAGRDDATIIKGICREIAREVVRRCLEIGDNAGALSAAKFLYQLGGRE